jgi:hypothetical protein
MRQTITALAILLACATAHGQSLMARNAAKAAERIAASTTALPQFAYTEVWYQFNATNWPQADSSADGNNTGEQATTTSRPTISGGVADFDGSADYFTINDEPGVLSDLSKFTMQAWIYDENSSFAYSGIVAADENTRTYRMGLWANVNYYKYYIWTVDDNFTSAPKKDEWHHIAVSHDSARTGDDTYLYLDGVLVNTCNAGTYATMQVVTYPWKIGRDPGYADGYWNGKLDEIVLWTVALTSNEVVQAYTVTNKGKR